MHKYFFIPLIMIFILFAGCTVGPDYSRPDADTPSAWRLEETRTRDTANTAWWELFDDPVLNNLISSALKENKDIRIAAAKVEELMGRYGATRAEIFPQISASTSAYRTQVSEYVNSPLPAAYNNPYNDYKIAGIVSWEIDIWGKIRRATEAAKADLLATEESRRTVIMSLVAAVAAAYVDLRGLDRELEIAESTLKSRKKTLELFVLRFEKGVISEMEVRQAQLEYESALANVPALQKLIGQQENLISILLGRNPGKVERGKTIDQLVLPAVPQGLPSDLLFRRPDIAQAEQDLIAANARIGAARAAYFPRISLTGSFGVQSAELSNLFTNPAQMWNFGMPVSVPIFTAGAIGGQVKAAEAVRKQLLLRYQQVIQQAYREVNNALIDQSKTREQLEAYKKQMETAGDYVKLAQIRYDNGYAGYLDVLDAERNLFNVQLAYVRTQSGLFKALVSLYKSMGGGWIARADETIGG